MRVAFQGRGARLGDLAAPLPLDSMVARAGAGEDEIGFGKGRYLIDRAERERGDVRRRLLREREDGVDGDGKRKPPPPPTDDHPATNEPTDAPRWTRTEATSTLT